MLQHLALFHGEALPVHALSLLQNAFECNYELISESVRWPLARVLGSQARRMRGKRQSNGQPGQCAPSLGVQQ